MYERSAEAPSNLLERLMDLSKLKCHHLLELIRRWQRELYLRFHALCQVNISLRCRTTCHVRVLADIEPLPQRPF